jgi:hypothetical protein
MSRLFHGLPGGAIPLSHRNQIVGACAAFLSVNYFNVARVDTSVSSASRHVLMDFGFTPEALINTPNLLGIDMVRAPSFPRLGSFCEPSDDRDDPLHHFRHALAEPRPHRIGGWRHRHRSPRGPMVFSGPMV